MAVFLTSKKRKEKKMTEKMSAGLEKLGVEMTGPYGGSLYLKLYSYIEYNIPGGKRKEPSLKIV